MGRFLALLAGHGQILSPVVGWCVGTIKARNTDGRFNKTIDGEREKVNFLVYYEIDDEEVKTVLAARC